jgi:hypothetical protein
MQVGDVTGAEPKGRFTDLYELLQAQEEESRMSIEQYRQLSLQSLDRSDQNIMAAEIKSVLSDALSALKSSGREVRDSGK